MFQFIKTSADESGDCFSFSHLPDEIVFQILSKLFDFKTLCVCKLVSHRFNQIVNQVDTISFNFLPVDHSSFDSNTLDSTLPIRLPVSLSSTPCEPVSIYQSESFLSAIKSLHHFTRLKSLRVEVPSSLKDVDNRCLFKWKMSPVMGSTIDSYVFLSPNLIFDTNGAYANGNVHHDEEQEDEVLSTKKSYIGLDTKGVYANGNVHNDEEREDMVLSRKKWDIGMDCFQDAVLRRWMLMDHIINFPLLQDVSVHDTNKRGSISVSGRRKIVELRKWLNSLSDETTQNRIDRTRGSIGYVPLLELPVSRYVMKGVFILLVERIDFPDDNFDSFLNCHLKDYVDKKESAYNEAIIEIFKKHRGRMKRIP